jgi:hypothetical protein
MSTATTLTVTVKIKHVDLFEPDLLTNDEAVRKLMPSALPTDRARVRMWLPRAISDDHEISRFWDDPATTDFNTTVTFTLRSTEEGLSGDEHLLRHNDQLGITLGYVHSSDNPLIDQQLGPHTAKVAHDAINIAGLFEAGYPASGFMRNPCNTDSPWEFTVGITSNLEALPFSTVKAPDNENAEVLMDDLRALNKRSRHTLSAIKFRHEILREFFSIAADGVVLPIAASNQSIEITEEYFVHLLKFACKQNRTTVEQFTAISEQYYMYQDRTDVPADFAANMQRADTILADMVAHNQNTEYTPDVAWELHIVDGIRRVTMNPCEKESRLTDMMQDCEGTSLRMSALFHAFRSFHNKGKNPLIHAAQRLLAVKDVLVVFGAARGARLKVDLDVAKHVKNVHNDPNAVIDENDFNKGCVGGHATVLMYNLLATMPLTARVSKIDKEVELHEDSDIQRRALVRQGITSPLLLAELSADRDPTQLIRNAHLIERPQHVIESTAPSCTVSKSARVVAANVQIQTLKAAAFKVVDATGDRSILNHIQQMHPRSGVYESEHPAFRGLSKEALEQKDFTIAMSEGYGRRGFFVIGQYEVDDDDDGGDDGDDDTKPASFVATASPFEMNNGKFAIVDIAPNWRTELRGRMSRIDRFASRPIVTLDVANRDHEVDLPLALKYLTDAVSKANPGVSIESETYHDDDGAIRPIYHAYCFPNYVDMNTAEGLAFVKLMVPHLAYATVDLMPLSGGEYTLATYLGYKHQDGLVTANELALPSGAPEATCQLRIENNQFNGAVSGNEEMPQPSTEAILVPPSAEST